jgi:BRCA1-associated protein
MELLRFASLPLALSFLLSSTDLTRSADDEYVHRLIRLRSNPSDPTSPSGERLIELPSLSNSARPPHSDPDDLSSKIGAAAGGPDRSAEVEQDKLEALAVEYGNLMTAQLLQQREYFEDEVARLKSLKQMGDGKRDELDKEVERLSRERVEVEKREKEREASWKKVRAELEARIDQFTRESKHDADERKKERSEALKARKHLEKELESERSVTASLTANLSSLRTDLAAQQRETNEVRGEVDELKETMSDLMAALSMRDKIEAEPEHEWAGASIGVAAAPGARQEGQVRESPSKVAAAKRKKKKKPTAVAASTSLPPPPPPP